MVSRLSTHGFANMYLIDFVEHRMSRMSIYISNRWRVAPILNDQGTHLKLKRLRSQILDHSLTMLKS